MNIYLSIRILAPCALAYWVSLHDKRLDFVPITYLNVNGHLDLSK